MRPILTALLAVGLLAGCGGPSASSPLMVTCDIRNNAGAAAHGQCQEWRGDKADETNAQVDFNVLCTSTLSGVVLADACPTGHVGLCTKRPSATERVVLHFYYAPDWDEATSKTDCTAQKGTWSAK